MLVYFLVYSLLVHLIVVRSIEVHEDVVEGPPILDVIITNKTTVEDSSEKVSSTEPTVIHSSGAPEILKTENLTALESLQKIFNGNASLDKSNMEHLSKPKAEKSKGGFTRQDDNLPKPSKNRENFYGREKLVKEHLQQVFIPSPEARTKSSDFTASPDFDSFQPVVHPYILMQKQLRTTTTPLPIERTTNLHDDTFVIDLSRGTSASSEYNNYKSQSDSGIWTESPVEISHHAHGSDGWKIVESEEQPETKILNFVQPELVHETEREATTNRPLQHTALVSDDYPYPFEVIKDDDIGWFEPPPRLQEENDYEDHNYKIIPPQRPYPVDADSSRHIWESTHTGGKEIVKPNSLHSILHVLSAIVPIGLLLSALTPNVVVINPNATSTAGRAPPNLNFFGARQRSLEKSMATTEPNYREVFNKLLRAVQNPQLDSGCTKRTICQLLGLLKEVEVADLQKTISINLERSHAKVSEVNVSLGELIEAARKDKCSIYTCGEMIAANSN